MRAILFKLFIFLAAGMVGVGPALAQVPMDPKRSELQLTSSHGLFQDDHALGPPLGTRDGAMEQGRTMTGTVIIPSPSEVAYGIVASCDQNCSALALTLRDPSGNVVDVQQDTYSGFSGGGISDRLLVIPPGQGGRYSYQVEMLGCVSVCHWRVSWYGEIDAAGAARVDLLFHRIASERGTVAIESMVGTASQGVMIRGTIGGISVGRWLFAACDETCGDMSLVLRNRVGYVLHDQFGSHTTAVYIPAGTDSFTWEMVMDDCPAICHYGLRTYPDR